MKKRKYSLTQFKNICLENGIKINFRKDVYIINKYGAFPIMDFVRAEKIVILFLEYTKEDLISNASMSLDSLKNMPLKSYLESTIEELNVRYI